MEFRVDWIKLLSLLILFASILGFTIPPASSFGIVYYGEAGQNPVIPQEGSENIPINVYNTSDNVYILIPGDEISVTTSDGENTPSDWWEFEVTPPAENHQIWAGYEWRYFQANFFLKSTDYLSEEPQPPYPDNYDSWVKFGDNKYALARRITITVTASENVSVGEYQLHVPISGRENPTGASGLEVVTGYEAKPEFYVTGPPPTQQPSPSPPLPLWATILAIGIVACLTGGLAYAIKKGKIGVGEEVDYEEVVQGSIKEVKSAVEKLENPDYEQLLEAEEGNKDRKTLEKWLKKKMRE